MSLAQELRIEELLETAADEVVENDVVSVDTMAALDAEGFLLVNLGDAVATIINGRNTFFAA